MEYKNVGSTYIIKLERGEEVITTLTQFCIQQGIENGYFSGIGAVEGLSCGYYALDEKKYYFKQYDSMVEVVSLSGNVALKEGAPFIHMHGVFTGTDNSAFGGHVEKMNSGIVVEIVLTALDSRVTRELDEDIGLFLFNCRD